MMRSNQIFNNILFQMKSQFFKRSTISMLLRIKKLLLYYKKKYKIKLFLKLL